MGDLSGLAVLVVGINYDPEHTGIAPYTTQAAEHLASLGAQVQVLTGVPHYPHWNVPACYRRRLRVDEQVRGIDVRRLRHFVPSQQTMVRRGFYELTFGARVRTQRLRTRPDVVLAVVPSLFGAAAAAQLARRHGARLVVWVHDLMGPATAQSGISGGGRITGITTNVEHRLLRRADKVLVLHESFERYVCLSGVAPDKVEVVRNWSHVEPPRGDRQATRSRLGWKDTDVVALHSGNMGLKQALENIVEAARLAAAAGSAVKFVLLGDGSQRESLQVLGQGIPNLEFLPPASNDEYADVLAAADVLLVNERGTAAEISMPSKLTSYFRAGGPVLGAVPAEGGTAREINASGAGRLVPPDDPAALLAGVEDLATLGDRAGLIVAARAYVAQCLEPSLSLKQIASAVARSSSVTFKR